MESTLVRTAPSEMGKLENYRALQRIPSQRILDDRPAPDSIPPVALLYDGFGSFMDVFGRQGDICHLDGKRRNLEMAVDSFAEKMADIYDDEEADRMEEGLRALNQILSLRCSGNKLMATSIGTVRSEGHYNGPHDAASCVVEFNDEIVDIGSIPTVKLVGYAAHSHRHAMELHPEVFRCWRVPCLGLTIVGKLNISVSSDEFGHNVHHTRPICHILRHNFPSPVAHCQPHSSVVCESR